MYAGTVTVTVMELAFVVAGSTRHATCKMSAMEDATAATVDSMRCLAMEEVAAVVFRFVQRLLVLLELFVADFCALADCIVSTAGPDYAAGAAHGSCGQDVLVPWL